jgi:hypothetical protein
MHLTLLLRLLKRHNLGHLVDTRTPEGKEGRVLVVGTVLATDMSWHFEWLERFGRAMKERQHTAADGPVPSSADDVAGGTAASTTLAAVSSGDGGWVLAEQEDEEFEIDSTTREEIDCEDRLFVCQALMKCADISNPVSTFGLLFSLRAEIDPALICSVVLTTFLNTGPRFSSKNGLLKPCLNVI